MKRGASQISKRFLSTALIIAALLFFGMPAPAQGAYSGIAPCVQTINTVVGVSVYQDGNSCFVAFKSAISYTWTPPSGVNTIDVLVVGGGGGGGSRHAGGGGAGGLINLTNQSISASNLTVIVGDGGAGGAAASTGGNTGSNGGNSSISGAGVTTRTAIGGGGGGYGAGTNSGGSGAGGGSSGAGGSGTAGQGNNGSAGVTDNSSYWVGGGGGGAGGQGVSASSTKGGNGGAGLDISWISATAQSNLSVGVLNTQKVYFAAGGGGGTDRNTITAGSAGLGGGGAGATGTGTPGDGLANTGGGGGGSGISGSGTGSFKGGNGGSGVVVIRYSLPAFTNGASFSVAENISLASDAAIITVTESSTLTIRPTLDSSLFTIIVSDSVTARVRFQTTPDYEAPSDIGANNQYDLVIRATNASGNFQEFTIAITVTDVIESASINTPSLSGTAYKGRDLTITVTFTVPGKVRFFLAGKRIPNCLAQTSTGAYPNYSATCSLKPSISGSRSIRATLTPSNVAISAVTSPELITFIIQRTNTR